MVFWCGAACRTGAWPISRPGARRARRSRSWWPLRGGAGPSRTRSRPPGPWAGPHREPVVARLAPACLAGDAGRCPAGAGAPAGERSAPKNGAHRQACRFPGRCRKSGASRSDWRNGALSQPSSWLGRLGGALIKPPHNRLTSNAGRCNCNASTTVGFFLHIAICVTMVRRSWMTGGSVEATLELWASSLRTIKERIRPVFRQDRTAASAGLFLDALLGLERRKTGWMRAEAAGDPGPWRQQALLDRSRWDADALRDLVRDDVVETLADPDAVLVIDETGFLKQGQASCGV